MRELRKKSKAPENQAESPSATSQPFEEERPSFNQTMSMQEVESRFFYERIEPSPREKTEPLIAKELAHPEKDAEGQSSFYEPIEATQDVHGPGRGFDGTELLSKDELNIILDLEDESQRLGDFKRIFPNAGSCHKYYGLMEKLRY